jgi:chromosome segregation ATPase
MLTGKAQHRIQSLEAQLQEEKGVRTRLMARVNGLRRELEDARNERSTLVARVDRLEQELKDARNDSRSRRRTQPLEVVGSRD